MITMKQGDYSHAKKTCAQRFSDVHDSELPGSTIIEFMESEMEAGELTAPRLNDIPSTEEVAAATRQKRDSSGIAVTFSTNGVKVEQPVKVKLPMPHDTEGVWQRISQLEGAVEFIKIRHFYNFCYL